MRGTESLTEIEEKRDIRTIQTVKKCEDLWDTGNETPF